MIKFNCGQCKHRFRVPDEYAGKKVRCKQCGFVNAVPSGQAVHDPERGNGRGAVDADAKKNADEFNQQYMDAFNALLKYEKEAPPIET